MENLKDYKKKQKQIYKEICEQHNYVVYKVDSLYRYKKCSVCGHVEKEKVK